ncbi:hypothetical protein AGLY_018011, partial [Aphis glycines]
MYFPQPLLLICILLILTERVHSQSAKGPGISSCTFADFREHDCKWPPLNVSEIPPECTSLNYLVAIIDENYCIGPAESGADYVYWSIFVVFLDALENCWKHLTLDLYNTPRIFNFPSAVLNRSIISITILDVLLKSGKDVYLYYGWSDALDWCKMLKNASTNSLIEMKSIKGFFKDHQGITGLILTGLSYDDPDPECPKFTENFKIYLDVMKKTFPNLAIGLDLFGFYLIDQFNDPKRAWLDFKVLDVSIDFYAVTMESFSPCNADFKTGTTIICGNTTNHTLDILADVLQKTCIPKAKTYFKFKTHPEAPDDVHTFCDMTNEKLCELPSNATSDWCSDTIAT